MILGTAKQISARNVLEGLRQGLSRFSGPSRAALIMAETPESELLVHDPRRLLRGHEPKLNKMYLETSEWRENAPDTAVMKPFGQTSWAQKLHLTGLICAGGYSQPLFYQMWFTELHPNMCSTGPIERWLEHAVWLLAHDYASEGAFFTSASKHALEAFEHHAVRNHIFADMSRTLGRPPQIPLYPILEAVLNISTTREEGERPTGRMIFIEPSDANNVPWLIRFPELERPYLHNAKHVRKLLLSVENSSRRLVSDGERVLGVSGPANGLSARLTADFQDRFGFLRLGGKPVCSFVDGIYQSTTRKPNLVLLEEALLESDMGPDHGHTLFQIASAIVDEARMEGFGCTLVLDPQVSLPLMAGQHVDPPLWLNDPQNLDLAKALAKLDGALHLTGSCELRAFACLLDGRNVGSEDRSRGARFNSALRFTAMHPGIIVVVVSADAPVFIFQGGLQLNAMCDLRHEVDLDLDPPSLEKWLQEA
ncbi:MAG: DNA integrity scanning protein DisA nucleotide-binding domain protein [Desulfovibrio sp.]|nr:DNA integrity scanning protein DisA nucleotide-binding domain protein [Desulfovibrio sp.]MBI4961401.1 DNA integrity scanning protein DisA nucleotide-binding domain protein [Desulfovibrio sp.]